MSEPQKPSAGGPEWLWAPVTAFVTTLAIGFVALLAGQPWLFPSLGPSIYLHVHKPTNPTSRPYHTIMGQLLGVIAGAIGIIVTGASQAPTVLAHQTMPESRMWASAIAMGLCLLFQVLLRASHPPAAATALLLTLGGFKLVPEDLIAITVGVALIVMIGEPLRRFRLGQFSKNET